MTDARIERDEYRRRLGLNLARIRAGLTAYSQEAIADLLGMNPDTYGRWERGDREPKAYDLMRLCVAFGVPADWLLFPMDSFTDLDRRIAQHQRVASAAAKAAVAEEQALRDDAASGAPLDRR